MRLTVDAVTRFVMQDRDQVVHALADDHRGHARHTAGFHQARVGLWACALVAIMPLALVAFLLAQTLHWATGPIEAASLLWLGVTGAPLLWNSVRGAMGGSPPFEPATQPSRSSGGGRVGLAFTCAIVVVVAAHQLFGRR